MYKASMSADGYSADDSPQALPENWRDTPRDPELPGDDLAIAEDGRHIIIFRADDNDAYVCAKASTGLRLGKYD